MASSQQGISTPSSSLPIARTSSHPQSNTYPLPRIQVAVGEAKHVQPRTPVTPDQRLRRPNRILDSDNTESLPDGGIALRQSDASDFPSRSTLQPASPSRAANIRLRRSQHGATLLQSPARAGHAARMRQIFEDAGRGYCTTPVDEVDLYPQLPNISRKASPLPFHDRPVQEDTPCISLDRPPPSLSMSPEKPLVVSQPGQLHPNLSCLSAGTSGSWSDDSGYFIADSRGRASALTISPKERIYDWLLKVSRVGSKISEDTVADESDDDPGLHHSVKAWSDAQELTIAVPDELRAGKPTQHSDEHLVSHQLFGRSQLTSLDPFINDEHNSGTCPPIGSRLGQEPFSLPSYRNIPRGHVSDVCKRLNSSQLGAPYLDRSAGALSSTTMPHISPLHDKHGTVSTPPERRTPKDGSIELSPLSPNVCIVRGPSRYHPNRKPPHVDHTSTSSKERPYTDKQTEQLKENVILREEKTSDFVSPLASRSARAGTRFQRSQYNTLTFNINKHIQ